MLSGLLGSFAGKPISKDQIHDVFGDFIKNKMKDKTVDHNQYLQNKGISKERLNIDTQKTLQYAKYGQTDGNSPIKVKKQFTRSPTKLTIEKTLGLGVSPPKKGEEKFMMQF